MPFESSLFSVSYAGYWGQERLGVREFIARAKSLGYRSVMLAGKRPHLSPLDTSEARLDEVRGALAEHGVRCAALAGYTDFAAQRAAEVPFLEMQLDYVASLCQLAAELDARYVRVFTAYDYEGSNPTETWQRVVTALREAGERAADFGVTLAVQNHHDTAVDSQALLNLLDDIGRTNVKLGFDAWSPALRGEPLEETARLLAPHTVMTTNADYVRTPRYRYRPELVNYERLEPEMVRAVPFGEGFIDYEGFFRGLSEGGFAGLANYEMCSPIRGGGSGENLDGYARQYLGWMERHAG
jgi:sugar phosphate isomerase/epimerase